MNVLLRLKVLIVTDNDYTVADKGPVAADYGSIVYKLKMDGDWSGRVLM